MHDISRDYTKNIQLLAAMQPPKKTVEIYCIIFNTIR